MKRYFHPVACAALVAASPLFSVQQGHAQAADPTVFHRYQAVDPLVEKAAKSVEAHRFAEAKEQLEPVLKLVPDHAKAHFLLAWMAYEDRDFGGALEHIETSERSLQDLSRCYAKIKADEKAKDELEALDIQTSIDRVKSAISSSAEAEDTGASDLLGAKQQELRHLESKRVFNGGGAFEVPAAYSFLHGNCLYRLGRPAEAAAQYKLAIHSDPTNAKAWNNLINLYREAKEFPTARAALAQAEAVGVAIQPKLKQSVLEGN